MKNSIALSGIGAYPPHGFLSSPNFCPSRSYASTCAGFNPPNGTAVPPRDASVRLPLVPSRNSITSSSLRRASCFAISLADCLLLPKRRSKKPGPALSSTHPSSTYAPFAMGFANPFRSVSSSAVDFRSRPSASWRTSACNAVRRGPQIDGTAPRSTTVVDGVKALALLSNEAAPATTKATFLRFMSNILGVLVGPKWTEGR
mmetsp:Transcript_42031/g.84573  ORF Transcript_42031/g.84573 Transcript_42031/m.84573 type:complete len:202 (-) Transcript_42031:25-630(-)